MELDFEIDKLTHSLEDTVTGKIFATETAPIVKEDLKSITKRNGWKFNWKIDFANEGKHIYKLILQQEPETVQGLVAFTVKTNYIYMDLIETAPRNYGSTKKYYGVLGNLVAFVCKKYFELGFEGEMGFDSKTQLIGHYVKELGARHFGGQRMVIWTDAATKLVNRYYPDFLTNK